MAILDAQTNIPTLLSNICWPRPWNMVDCSLLSTGSLHCCVKSFLNVQIVIPNKMFHRKQNINPTKKIWLNITPLYQPIISKIKTIGASLHALPAFGAGNMYLLRVLIGSLDCLRLLWLARLITLVLVLRHSIENRSYNKAIFNWLQRY